MKIRTGAIFQGRSVEVEVDENDFPPTEYKSLDDKFAKMMATGDRLVVKYLYQEGLINSDQAKTRMIGINKVLNG